MVKTKFIQGVKCYLLPVDFLEKALKVIFEAHGGYESEGAKEFNKLTQIIHKRGFIDDHLEHLAAIQGSELLKIQKEYNRVINEVF